MLEGTSTKDLTFNDLKGDDKSKLLTADTVPSAEVVKLKPWYAKIPFYWRVFIGFVLVLALALAITIPFAMGGGSDPVSPRPSPAPPPPLPPAPPGLVHVPAVKFSTVVAGTVASFDQAAYKSGLASLVTDVEPSDITLAVSAGSVVVDATIVTTGDTSQDRAILELSAYNVTALSTTLGVTVESVTAPVKTTGLASEAGSGEAASEAGSGEAASEASPPSPSSYLCIQNYYPLFLDLALSNSLSPTNESHVHVFDAVTYYMPNGFAGNMHDDQGPCPDTAYYLPPSPPPAPNVTY